MIKDDPPQHQQQSQQGSMMIGNNGGNDFMPMPQGKGDSDSMGMWAMMNFLTSQQRMAMQQQQFQMMQGMEQRKLDQSREEGQRRVQNALSTLPRAPPNATHCHTRE